MKKLFLPWRSVALSGPLFLILCIVAAVHSGFNASTPIQARARTAASPTHTEAEVGMASYYGAKYQGRPTASGENFDMTQLTAAHPTCAFGTRVKVTNLKNNRSVIVRINDRGPFIKGRIIDLSLAAAEELQMVESGTVEVRVEILR